VLGLLTTGLQKLKRGYAKASCISRKHVTTTAESKVAAAILTLNFKLSNYFYTTLNALDTVNYALRITILAL